MKRNLIFICALLGFVIVLYAANTTFQSFLGTDFSLTGSGSNQKVMINTNRLPNFSWGAGNAGYLVHDGAGGISFNLLSVQSPMGFQTIGGVNTIVMTRSGNGTNGWLHQTDWATFNAKASTTYVDDAIAAIPNSSGDGFPMLADGDADGYSITNASSVETKSTNNTPGRLYLKDADGSNYVRQQSPTTILTNYNIIWPDVVPTGLFYFSLSGETNVEVVPIANGSSGQFLGLANGVPLFQTLPPTSSSFSTQTINVTNTNAIVLDLSQYNRFLVRVLTNFSFKFTNQTSLATEAYLYLHQDTNGGWTNITATVSGGLFQSNASYALTTNANAMDVIKVLPGFESTNLIVRSDRDFLPRTSFTNSIVGGGGGGGPAFTPDFVETFDNVTDFDNSGWTAAGTINANYSAAALEGTQSIQFNDGSIYRTVAANQTNFYCTFRITTWTNYDELFFFRDGASANAGGVILDDTNHRLGFLHGSTYATSTTQLSLDTTYYIWGVLQAGTGADGIGQLYISTTATKPGSPDVNISNGNGTAAVDTLIIRQHGVAIVDRVMTHSSAIPSNP